MKKIILGVCLLSLFNVSSAQAGFLYKFNIQGVSQSQDSIIKKASDKSMCLKEYSEDEARYIRSGDEQSYYSKKYSDVRALWDGVDVSNQIDSIYFVGNYHTMSSYRRYYDIIKKVKTENYDYCVSNGYPTKN